MPNDSPFDAIAGHYDTLMDHVDYRRWTDIVSLLGSFFDGSVDHLDAACGTGVLGERVRRPGWNVVACDLSRGMVREARSQHTDLRLVQGDMCSLPFCESFDLVTCLFDSINFVLDDSRLQYAFESFAAALRSPGVLYFDLVTERMVTEHFEGPAWTEENGVFQSSWKTTYARSRSVAETELRLSTGANTTLRERIYPLDMIRQRLDAAGFEVASVVDADTWKAPRKHSTRIDIVATKDAPAAWRRRYTSIAQEGRSLVLARRRARASHT